MLIAGFCFIAFGSSLTLWVGLNRAAALPSPTSRREIVALKTPTPTSTPTLTVTPSPTPTLSATKTPSPTATATFTPAPPSLTPTPIPPTHTPSPLPPPPNTPPPTATPTPPFSFVVAETAQFPTSHLDFDVYIAITDRHNAPLSGYRVLARHSSGQQFESAVSAGAWTENSGAKHYKAGNIKYHLANSSGGVWSLQLVDAANQPVAPAVECPFDPAGPAWYFILYRKSQ
jgi:hypothetical protein